MDADHLIARQEGFRGVLYDDATGRLLGPGDTIKGHPTVGYGFALDRRPMPELVADVWRRSIVADVAEGLYQRAPWVAELDQVRRAVLISMGYQLGLAGVLNFRRMLAALERGDHEEAAREVLDSKAAREQAPRRYREFAAMLRTGHWPKR